MRMREMGLVTVWKKPYEADASKCIAKAKERPPYPRLSILQLTGAFVVLAIGYTLSASAFACEIRNRKCVIKERLYLAKRIRRQ